MFADSSRTSWQVREVPIPDQTTCMQILSNPANRQYLGLISRAEADFANEPFPTPVELHFATQLSNHSFDDPTAKALTRRLLGRRTIALRPAKYQLSIRLVLPF